MNSRYHLNNLYFEAPLEYGGIALLQIGRMHCNETTVIESHVHRDLYELTVVTGGRGRIYTNGIPTPVERGDIYLSFPGDTHCIDSNGEDPLQFNFFAFRCETSVYHRELEQLVEAHYSPQKRCFRNERVAGLVGDVLAEVNGAELCHEELMAALLNQIMVYLIRDFRRIAPKKADASNRAEELCYRLMYYIDTHIYTMKNLQELAEVTNYSYGYLSAVFKKTTAQTLVQYYNEKKADIARMLVLENRMKSVEIAELLHYSSVYAFSKAFTARFGLSPRAYRRREEDKTE